MIGSCVGTLIFAYAGYVLASRAWRVIARKGKGGCANCAHCPWASAYR